MNGAESGATSALQSEDDLTELVTKARAFSLFAIRRHFVRKERIVSAKISADRFLTTRLLRAAPMSARSATHT
jgi:hypothetical protein